ncbi:hypothetical protein [Helicobacter sp. T3_23-1059]
MTKKLSHCEQWHYFPLHCGGGLRGWFFCENLHSYHCEFLLRLCQKLQKSNTRQSTLTPSLRVDFA